jgi:hypothetical protein
MTGKIVGINRALSGRFHLTLELNEDDMVKALYDKLHDKPLLDITIKQYRKKRSLNANAYAWALLDKMAKELQTTSKELYEHMLCLYGYSLYDEDGMPVIISVLATINASLLGKHLKMIGEGHVGDKVFNHYKVIRGSSKYDSKEMSTFIDNLVNEAKELGIETLTPDELERMKAEWKA